MQLCPMKTVMTSISAVADRSNVKFLQIEQTKMEGALTKAKAHEHNIRR
jgi:hypothetical protein